MQILKNETLIRALFRETTERTPAWIMRQAGRYLPEYRQVRAEAGDFLTMCTTPDLACEVTLQPVRRFPLDAAILFSDILTIPHAMGLGLHFVEGEGPKFERPLRSEQEIRALPIPDPEQELRYVTDTIRLILRALDGSVPLIGFSGSPWTLACYMVEGGSSREFARIKTMLYDQPAALHLLLDKLAMAVTAYLNAQIAAGVHVVMIFDTWGGILAPQAYQEFSLRYAQHVRAGLRHEREGRRIPVIFFTKGGGQWLETMADAGFDAIGLDWTTDLGLARARVGDRVALQGNLDPAVLYARPEVIREQVRAVLDAFGPGNGHVFNLGHGITPDVHPEHLGVLIDAVHALSPGFHCAD